MSWLRQEQQHHHHRRRHHHHSDLLLCCCDRRIRSFFSMEKKSTSGSNMMGAIPRKKLPPLPTTQGASGAAAVPPPHNHHSSSSSLHKNISDWKDRDRSYSHQAPSFKPPPSTSSSPTGIHPLDDIQRRPPKKKRRSLPIVRSQPQLHNHEVPSPEYHPSSQPHDGGENLSGLSSTRIQVMSEQPFLLRINTAGMIPRDPSSASSPSSSPSGLSRLRRQARLPKRKRPSYQEVEEEQEDDLLLTDSDNEEQQQHNNGKPRKKRLSHYDPSGSSTGAFSSQQHQPYEASSLVAPGDTVGGGANVGNPTMTTALAPEDGTHHPAVSADQAAATAAGADTSPPPGVLHTLWYSGEAFLHIFVLEKICAWKTRWNVQLVNETGEIVHLNAAEATAWQTKAIQDGAFWSDPHKRTEVSRILPTKCPVVLAMAAAQAHEQASLASAAGATNVLPKYRLQAIQKEEVLLVKWRGRSFLHCSWERASDLQRLDPSNAQTARHKIRRYYQTQEQLFGPEWKKLLEEERSTAATIHSGAGTVAAVTAAGAEAAAAAATPEEEGEEFFSPQCLEVERILACDENEMNPQVLAKQRALNMRDEQEAMKLKERLEDEETAKIVAAATATATSASTGTAENDHQDAKMPPASPVVLGSEAEKAVKALLRMVEDLIDPARKEAPWDPEDNVRYVVKWRGLPYAEMTWEYWRDIKRDAVDEAEDFWYRQQPPPIDDAIKNMKLPHPNIRDFRKLQESPLYGTSKRERPVADLDGNDDAISSSIAGDEDDGNGGFRLRSYQLEGVNWLLFNWWNKRSCILADEMGLGKTIQSAAFLQELQTQPATQVRGPFLIVAPLSLIGQWQSELRSWAPDINVVLYHGSADARDFLVQHEFYYTEQFVNKVAATKLKKNHITKFHVLITTYEVVLKDIAVLSKVRWRTLIVDEAHRLKNPKARLFEELANVPRDYCVLLTGTPIANATEELWALLHFANPHVFKDKDNFLEKFGAMTDAKQVSELHSLLRPYLLRRVKEDVEKSLPPKEETILEVSLTPIQKQYYKAIYERNISFLYKGAKPSNAPSLMNVMMELRKCCNHPYLVKGAEERILADAAARLKDLKDENGNLIPIDQYKLFAEQLVKSSGKMVLMEKLLQKLYADGHKVLIFSQMVRVLDLLEELLKMKKYRYERLDGSTSSSSRAHAVDRFKRKSLNRFVMLLSTRAGGLGLNLTTADIVIIFDSDWNPQNDLQAMARAHRIGQTKAVQVFRLLTAKTYEMHLFHTASLKLGLERAVLSQNRDQGSDESDDNKRKKKSDREAQAKEIDELLKKGAYDVFRDEDDKDAEKFMETDIDQLLEHSSKKVIYGTNSSESLGKGLGSFNKASFVANTGEGEKDVDLDDPDFWSKAVGLEAPEETSEDIAAMIDDGVKRSRKQVQVYDPYAETAEAEQRKKERIALEKMLEKEEKERLRLEKKMKKKEAKEKKKREREEQKQQQLNEKKKAAERAAAAAAAAAAAIKAKTLKESESKKEQSQPKPEKSVKEVKPKKSKKSDRLRALRRAENEDPVLERLKQAWEVPQRSKATAAVIRFGFNRFCKMRNESNLTSLPLQDLETFVRSYIYQLSLQVAVILLKKLRDNPEANDLRPLFQEWLGPGSPMELNWMCDAVQSVMQMHVEVENRRRFLRMPLILVEPAYVEVLRQGAAFRALRRIGVLVRLNRLVEDCVDSIMGCLGHEELGKRGCLTNEITTLDVDLKARYVTTEELALAISSKFRALHLKAPSSWWDRSCDVGLVIGTFIHGLGNYHAMRNDPDLPFMTKLKRIADEDEPCKEATERFLIAAHAVRKVFDDALESARIKAELEVQAAVAAAAKAASKREEDAALLRKGGAEAEAVASSMPDTQVENAFEFDGTDSHFVTLPRMHSYVAEAVRKSLTASSLSAASNNSAEFIPDQVKSEEDPDDHAEDGATGRLRSHQKFPMPDARVLDYRLLMVLKEIETVAYRDELPAAEDPNPDLWRKTDDVLTNMQVRAAVLAGFLDNVESRIDEYSGVGLGGNQCGTSHRTLNDGSDYGFGSATNQLAQVYIGTDAPRYLRAIGVPMNITRFAVSGLVYAEAAWVEQLLATERLRFYGDEESMKKKVSGACKEERSSLNADQSSKDAKAEKTGKTEDSTSRSVETLTSLVEGNKTVAIDAPEKPIKHDSDSTHGEKDVESSRRITPVDPVDRIADVFRENAQLRAHICIAVLLYGFPASTQTDLAVQSGLWQAYKRHGGAGVSSDPASLFGDEDFRDVVVKMAPDVEVPDVISLRKYVETVLLPFCCRLCVSGNGPSTRGARGSQGEYETAFGVSLHPEPSELHPSPLPDPCLTTQEHSLEALGQAHAILRRVRLLRSSHYICTKVPYATIETVTRSKFMVVPQDMPVWWSPIIHDIALLVQCATKGVFSVLRERNEHPIFSPASTNNSLRSFVSEGEFPSVNRAPHEQVQLWIERQSADFPSLFQLERRLAFLCSRATAELESEARYDNIPMWDHGGWPRN